MTMTTTAPDIDRLETQRINRYRVAFLTADHKYLIRKYLLAHLFRLLSLAAFGVAPLLPRALIRLDRPIFIVGCSRSGTTLFVDIFARHAELANWTEGAQLFELDYYNPQLDHLRDETDASLFHRRRLAVQIGLFTRLSGKRRFVNKHPQNSLRIRFLRRIFPNALFIHVIRDGRAVVRSSQAQIRRDRFRQRIPFGNFPKPPQWRAYRDLPEAAQFAHQWVDVIDYIRGCFTPDDAGRSYFELRYEDFCADPRHCLERLDAFCGLSPTGRAGETVPAAFDRRGGEPKLAAPDSDEVMAIIAPSLTALGYG